jgi:cytochrome c peroxidase
VFDSPVVDIDRITTAIATFEDTLVTPNARFDKWLQGDAAALTADERSGYELFKKSGCAMCHNGPAAGGTSFRKMGVVEPYRTDNPAEGRYAVTGRDADRFNF